MPTEPEKPDETVEAPSQGGLLPPVEPPRRVYPDLPEWLSVQDQFLRYTEHADIPTSDIEAVVGFLGWAFESGRACERREAMTRCR